jgi:preprotein translocase subunit SecG
MYPFIVALHIILCLLMVLIILLQPGKGDIGAAFGGGGSSTMFGPRGPTNLLQQATTVVAVLFMCTSLTLAYYSSQKVLSNANIEQELQRLQKKKKAEAVAPMGIEDLDAPPVDATPDELPTSPLDEE